jgi:hypothetical protein
MRKRWIIRALGVGLLITVIAAVLGEVVMQLWNWLTPSLFGWHEISFWQALGLLVLSRILFGGFRGRPGFRRGRMRERWEQMTPEERDKLRQGLRGRCGPFEAPAAES